MPKTQISFNQVEDAGFASQEELDDAILSGITELFHRQLDSLLHNLVEDVYYEIIRTNGKVSNVKIWDNPTKSKIIREFFYTRTNGKVSSINVKQYDNDNIVVEEYNFTINRLNGKIESINGDLV